MNNVSLSPRAGWPELVLYSKSVPRSVAKTLTRLNIWKAGSAEKILIIHSFILRNLLLPVKVTVDPGTIQGTLTERNTSWIRLKFKLTTLQYKNKKCIIGKCINLRWSERARWNTLLIIWLSLIGLPFSMSQAGLPLGLLLLFLVAFITGAKS